MLPAVIAAILSSSNEVMYRFMLKQKRISSLKFNTIAFFGIAIILLPIIPFFFEIKQEFFEFQYMFPLIGMVLAAILSNILFYEGLKHTKIENAEPLKMSAWIFTIILAFVIFSSERNVFNIILALIASVSILSIRIKKHHFKLDKFSIGIIVSAFIWSIHIIFLKKLLFVYNPVMLAFLRAGLAALILVPFIKITKKDFRNKKWRFYSIGSIFEVIAWIAVLFSYQTIGLVLTSMFMMLIPMLSEWMANIFLNEKLHWKNFAATAVVSACIGISLII